MGRHEPMRVLIADDESLAGEQIRDLVEKAGYTAVGEAFDGYEAVSMTDALRPDVVLMDAHMPNLDGFEATRQILERNPTPVVMLTAHCTSNLIEKARDAGAGAYLVKPSSRQEIERTIAVATARFHDMMELRRVNVRLQAEITEQRQLEAQLRQVIQDREMLVRETHHRVKNNLGAVVSLLNLQAEASDDPCLRDLLQGSIRRIHSVAAIHDCLYQAQHLERVDLGRMLSTLATDLFYSLRKRDLRLSLALEPGTIFTGPEKSFPCALILNELMMNALKYAFPNGKPGEIRVEAHSSKEQILLHLSDDGVGMPKHIQVHQTESFGLRLVMALAQKLHGTLDLQGEKGCAYTLIFPAT